MWTVYLYSFQSTGQNEVNSQSLQVNEQEYLTTCIFKAFYIPWHDKDWCLLVIILTVSGTFLYNLLWPDSFYIMTIALWAYQTQILYL